MTPLFRSIARMSLLVHDYDEALAFYGDVLGFDTLYDDEIDERGRFLHVGLPEQGVGLWLRQAVSDDQRALVGQQSGGQPLLVLYADDCHRVSEVLRERGVHIRRGPYEDGGAVVIHIDDLYGNEIIVAELDDQV